ncbi:pyrimidine 5'-nucleotidase [Halteromyces radiatus]|uniref:pyrimidine 5'-nucleotidase n=1 Tax=Halteromyces radiatus TaxID=101107 RepID=UPI00222055B8|nr:pyrimidine 5'-nucleotidase [Halteromyces radiatus]KAI8079742.1 pyrimidine 5'-nucleotidase [Halteromyces radiatus]
MVDESDIELRPGLEKVLSSCRDSKIPFLVFSAGIGDLIERVLLKRQMMYDNMHLVSNMMKFNQADICVGFNAPLIHVLNKSEVQVEQTPYASQIETRPNVILIGDSCADTQMAHGIKHDCCLNIGLLNHDIEHLEPRYLQTFDIVIEGDANLNPILAILDSI